MDTYTAVKSRIMDLCYQKRISVHKLAIESGISPSTLKGILYGRSKNPGIVTIKMLCDGFGITLVDFFNTKEFKELEQEIK
ncbi:MAG: helix-turn-helix domain-containing protein [Clostridia bacterium]|nr:helix-turn-helix domain-containing protein [Clostridia bacterium]MDE7328948.1 helix-turn-helix domain-containing protein [Clostridia bacterium]